MRLIDCADQDGGKKSHCVTRHQGPHRFPSNFSVE
jgi:hypothetical protein